MNEGEITIMNRIYGLRNDKENMSLIIGDDKATLIIQTAESYEVRDLNLEFDVKLDESVSLEEIKPIKISANEITTGDVAEIARYALKGIANNLNVDSKVKITEDGVKTSSANNNFKADGTGEKIEIKVGELRTQTTFLMSKVDYLETKLKEKDEEISKLKDLTNTKVSSKEFWDFVKYHKDENDALLEVEPIDIAEYYKDETQQKDKPEPVQRALKRIKEIDYITDVRIDEKFKTTVDGFPENRLTITIDYLDLDFVEEMKKADKYKGLNI